MQFDTDFIQKTLSEATLVSGYMTDVSSISIDTRTLQPGALFIALPGVCHDGHTFITDAMAAGAVGCIVNRSWYEKTDRSWWMPSEGVVVVVSDTYQALFALARAWRNQFSYPVVAITGSVGKTSTKEILAAMLSHAQYRCCIAPGNQNTELGIALAMLRMRSDHTVALFEVGVSQRGEMKHSVALLRPTNAVIIGVGHAHMAGLGSLRAVAQEKRRVFAYFHETDIGVINGDQTLLADVAYRHPVIKFGTKTTNQIQARKIRTHTAGITFVLKLYTNTYTIQLDQYHKGAVVNILAAASIAYWLGAEAAAIVAGAQEQPTVAGRFEKRKLVPARGAVINDCYNANPESMKEALRAFQVIPTYTHKIAVLGDMLEMGYDSPFWHRQIGRFLRNVPSLDHLILVGPQMARAKTAAPIGLSIDIVHSWYDAYKRLLCHLKHDSVILIKGSRGMRLDALVSQISTADKEQYGSTE